MNAKELLDKYIKYDSKITFDIFKLIYQKLIDLNFTTPHKVEYAFEEFSGLYQYFIIEVYDDMLYFNQYGTVERPQSEISIEDLLGYNPFESFKLPEKWYIQVMGNSNNYPELEKWRGFWHYQGISYIKSNKVWTANFPKDFTEITLEDFKQFVMEETTNKTEEVIPEYVECYDSTSDTFIINKIYKCEPLSKADALTLNSEKGLINNLPYEGALWKFKPSTKEAFESQNKSQSIQKWGKGSYVVCIQDYSTHFKVGDIGQIENVTSSKNNYIDISKSVGKACLPFKDNCQWFATLKEAEKFTKSEFSSDKIETTPKFEAGKWYRITDGKSKCIGKDIWYAKSIVVRDNIIIAGEYWHNYLDTNGNFGNVGDYTFTEVPLSEIQCFLPDGHPDKFVKEAEKVIKTDTSRVRVTSSEIKVLKI